jgi:hypothetical protein
MLFFAGAAMGLTSIFAMTIDRRNRTGAQFEPGVRLF